MSLEFSRTVDTLDEAQTIERFALSRIQRIRSDLALGLSACKTIRELLPAFLNEQRVIKDNASTTVRDYERRLIRFANELSCQSPHIPNGDISPDLITLDMLHEWIRRRLQDRGNNGKYSPSKTIARGTLNNDLKALRTFAKWCVNHKHLSPASDILAVQNLRVKNIWRGRHTPRWLVRHNFLSILKKLREIDPRIELVLRGMLLLGARPAALFDIQWRGIELPDHDSAGRIEIPPVKGGVASNVPVYAKSARLRLLHDAKALHVKIAGRVPSKRKYLFPRNGDRPWKSTSFGHALQAAAKAANISDRFTSYMARHSAITWLKQAGVSPVAIQHYAKHLLISTQEFYNNTTGADAAPAYDQMDSFLLSEVDQKTSELDEAFSWLQQVDDSISYSTE